LGFVLRWALLGVCLLGHLSLFVFLFNRINATGLNRKLIKAGEKLIIAMTAIIPVVVLLIDQDWIIAWLSGVDLESGLFLKDQLPHWLTLVFVLVGLVSLAIQAPKWVLGRPSMHRANSAIEKVASARLDSHQLSTAGAFAKPWVKGLGLIPGNQLHLIEVNTHQVCMNRLPNSLDGLRIGHLSDMHLTGYMHRDFYELAIDNLMQLLPEIVILSGDVIDYDHCLAQVQPLLERVQPPLGAYFVLGNHDRRLSNVPKLRKMLAEVGWHDLGSQSLSFEKNNEEVFLVGNEKPWFDLESRRQDETARREHCRLSSLRIGVSHSPDQLAWAQQLELDLLFCGHTHGGQVRFPLIGPIIAPSWYGSRYASGWFEKKPTLMHVSRGLSGTHPIRFACTPEVTLCILKSNSSRPSVPTSRSDSRF
jgi:uncharacterized protein